MSVLFPLYLSNSFPLDRQTCKGKKYKGQMILKDSIFAPLGKYLGGGIAKNGKRCNYLCLSTCCYVYLLAIFDYEKGCFTLKKMGT